MLARRVEKRCAERDCGERSIQLGDELALLKQAGASGHVEFSSHESRS